MSALVDRRRFNILFRTSQYQKVFTSSLNCCCRELITITQKLVYRKCIDSFLENEGCSFILYFRVKISFLLNLVNFSLLNFYFFKSDKCCSSCAYLIGSKLNSTFNTRLFSNALFQKYKRKKNTFFFKIIFSFNVTIEIFQIV